jgi:hypothetical protein
VLRELSDKDGMVLIWTFNSDLKAEQAKALLESNGYFVSLNNSYSSRFNYFESFMNATTGSIRLYTKKSQSYDAYVLLAMHDFVPMKDIMTSANSGIEEFQRLMSKIPFLKSLGIIAQIFIFGTILALILLLIIKA